MSQPQDIPPVPVPVPDDTLVIQETKVIPVVAELPSPEIETTTPPSWPPPGPQIFVIEDSFYRTLQPSPVHWSVSWSDLMMTMFILFLAMFVYQASHKEFLMSDTPEILGGSTTDALDIMEDGNLFVPIVPLAKKGPPVTPSSVREAERIPLNDLDIDNIFSGNVIFVEPAPEEDSGPNGSPETSTLENPPPPPDQGRKGEVIEPAPLLVEEAQLPEIKQRDTFSEMYDMGRLALTDSNLNRFASIELVPDKTMRIILTSDLLFFTGQADLSTRARASLKKLARTIQKSPYMINVIGHTDNQPMHSSRFASNWELSVVRASSVTRFLINEMRMAPTQFVVSGYGSNRPRRPNTNTANRALNRRVEIIISKRLAPTVKATPENLF